MVVLALLLVLLVVPQEGVRLALILAVLAALIASVSFILRCGSFASDGYEFPRSTRRRSKGPRPRTVLRRAMAEVNSYLGPWRGKPPH